MLVWGWSGEVAAASVQPVPADREPLDPAAARALVEIYLDRAMARSNRLTLAEVCGRLGVDEAEVHERAAPIRAASMSQEDWEAQARIDAAEARAEDLNDEPPAW